MRLVAINGSPHGASGGTARIAEWLFAACAAEGVTIERFQLAGLRVENCRGCGTCMRAGRCVIDDDVPPIHAALQAADLVVLASPTYVFHVSGLMKTFIDRTAALFHRPPLEGKYAAVVTSSAGMGESEVIRYLGNCLQVLGAGFVGAVWGTYRPPTRLWEPDAVRERAARLGRDLVRDAREKRAYPLTDQLIAERRFLRELIWQNRKIFKEDFTDWQTRGWFESLPGTEPAGRRERTARGPVSPPEP
jgi:multimeric flavodoxin WrbA